MDTFDLKLNPLPSLAWNQLKMNNTTVKDVIPPKRLKADIKGAESIKTDEYNLLFDSVMTGCGEELSLLLKKSGIESAAIVLSGSALVHVKLDFGREKAEALPLYVYVKENFSGTLIMDYKSSLASKGQAIVQSKIYMEENSKLNLVQINRLAKDFTLFNDIGALLRERSSLNLTQILLSGDKNYFGAKVDLTGDESAFDSATAYALKGEEMLDMNFVALHRGKRSFSNIEASGSLRGKSEKLWRATIDFVRGSKEASGRENERILLLSDSAVNRTIPLILCAEEDVAGDHGATIGRPDEDELFYMASRGIEKQEVYSLLIRAKLYEVAERIPDDEFREEIKKAIGEIEGA